MLKSILANVVSVFATIPAENIKKIICTAILDKKAFKYSSEEIKDDYIKYFEYSDYYSVIENFRINLKDIDNYISRTKVDEINEDSLYGYLSNLIYNRSLNWEYNRPSEEVINRMVNDFYSTFFNYYLKNNDNLIKLFIYSKISNVEKLLLKLTNNEILEGEKLKKTTYTDIASHFYLYNIQIKLLEETESYFDISLYDENSIIPSTYHISFYKDFLNLSEISEIKLRARSNDITFSNMVIVVDDIDEDQIIKIEKREIKCFRLDNFLKLYSSNITKNKFFIGKYSAIELEKKINTYKLFVEPDLVEAYPDCSNSCSDRINAFKVIDTFLHSNDNILFLLGDYGSGKTALVTNIFNKINSNNSNFSTSYIPLKEISDSEKLLTTTNSSVKALNHLYPNYKSLIILDGLDEIQNAMNINDRRDNILSIIECSKLCSKIIVTIRTTYFRGLDDFWSLINRDKKDNYWDEISSILTNTEQNPTKIRTYQLKDFDETQINEFIRRYGEVKLSDYSYFKSYKNSIEVKDTMNIFHDLHKNPLYLYLLVTTKPWENRSILNITDILNHFIKFWLKRDYLKGRSRWLMKDVERLEFYREVAIWLYNNKKVIFSFEDFKSLVKKYITFDDIDESFYLDLQTTGIFSLDNQEMSFALNAFFNYFISDYLSDCWEDNLNRLSLLPNVQQSLFFLGMLEVGQVITDSSKFNVWLETKDIDFDFDERINFSSKGILFGTLNNDNWSTTNQPENSIYRVLINHSIYGKMKKLLYTDKSQEKDEILDEITVKLKVLNRAGLHSRTSAILILAAVKSDIVLDDISIEFKGEVSNMDMVNLLCLGVSYTSTIDINFANCNIDKIYNFLDLIGAYEFSKKVWATKFPYDID